MSGYIKLSKLVVYIMVIFIGDTLVYVRIMCSPLRACLWGLSEKESGTVRIISGSNNLTQWSQTVVCMLEMRTYKKDQEYGSWPINWEPRISFTFATQTYRMYEHG